MFIRRVRTGSGATAVQVAESRPGTTVRIVKHVGSAHSEAELGVLMARARELVEELSQQNALELEMPVPVVPLTTAPTQPALVGEAAPRPTTPVAGWAGSGAGHGVEAAV